jgi:ferredoxin-thioredoxin reductase catalytic subunit
MLELTDDHETSQVFVEKKMIPADFVGNNLVIQIDQDITCPCCLKKTSLYGFNLHTCVCYLYCYKFDKLQQYQDVTCQKILHEDLQQVGEGC